MQLEQQIKRCSELFYKLCDDVQRLNSLNYYDINISSENFFIHLLNIIFDWNLKNENFTEKNTAAIDLADKDNRIAIQVTSDDSAKKIRKTLIVYRDKELYKQYDRLIIIVIKKRKSYTANFDSAINGRFNFDKKHNIFTIDELIQKIQDLGYQKVAKICEYLEFQLGTVMDRNRVWTIASAFQEISENTNGYLNEDFFEVDDYRFKESFVKEFENTEIHVKGSDKEETLYCILNQINRLSPDRKTYIFRDEESWIAAKDNLKSSIVIPFFEANQIPILQGNTNIFIHGIGMHRRGEIELRRRTRGFLADKLRKNHYEDAHNLIQKTNGVYFYLKKELFKGQLISPPWGHDKNIAVVTAVLAGGWCESDDDKQILETLLGMQYPEFIDHLVPYIGIEMPLILKKTYHNPVSYEIADSELAWFEINNSISADICNRFLTITKQVISDRMNLYSSLLKEGMLRSMTFLAVHNHQQSAVSRYIAEILSEIHDAESWGYIAKYMEYLCEASPEAVISRLEVGLHDDTGMFEMFAESSTPYLWGRSNYIHILWSVEMLLGLEQYAPRAVRWLMELSDNVEKCSSGNNPRDIVSKIFCVWYNAAAISLEDKLYLAEEALKKHSYFWDILFDRIRDIDGIIIPNQEFSYRENDGLDKKLYLSDVHKQIIAFYELLFTQMNCSTEKWLKMVQLFPKITDEMLDAAVITLEKDIESMSDSEREKIQYELRKIIYKHRFFAQTDWAVNEKRIARIESVCNNISFEDEYYNFLYITKSGDFLNSHPVPYSKNNYRSYHDENEKKRQQIIQEKIQNFKEKQLDISHLLELAGTEASYEFGYAIAKFYSDGKYNEEILKKMLSIPHVSQVISCYIRWCYHHDTMEILNSSLVLVDGYDDNNELFFSVLNIPPLNHELIEMLDAMPPEKQYGYWKFSFRIHNLSSPELLDFAMSKLFEYGLWKEAVDMICRLKEQFPIDVIIRHMEWILKQINEENLIIDNMISWDIKEIIDHVETSVACNYEQYPQLFAIEMKLLLVIDWENAKCVQYHMKRNAQLFADIINMASIKRSDRELTDDVKNIRMNHYRIHQTMCFCPGETNGQIDRSVLENWISDFQSCLEKQNQSDSFYRELGRLFAYSPVGSDGSMPHEVVREMVEKYGNTQLKRSYLIATINKRNIYNVTYGEAEHKMASDYKMIAQKFRMRWPKTAGIYDNLAEWYESQSVHDRLFDETY